jgi:hypothetical protein
MMDTYNVSSKPIGTPRYSKYKYSILSVGYNRSKKGHKLAMRDERNNTRLIFMQSRMEPSAAW